MTFLLFPPFLTDLFSFLLGLCCCNYHNTRGPLNREKIPPISSRNAVRLGPSCSLQMTQPRSGFHWSRKWLWVVPAEAGVTFGGGLDSIC